MIQFKQLISKVLNEISDETIKKTKEYSDTLKDIETTTKELGKTTKELGLGEIENPQPKFPGISIQDIKQIPGYDPLRVNIDSGGAIFVDGEFIGDAGSDRLINKLNQDKDLYLTYKSYILNKIEDKLNLNNISPQIEENKELDKTTNELLIYKREVKLMTDPRIQKAWVSFYKGKISGDTLRRIIKSICVGFDSMFYEYVDDMSLDPKVPPTSSGSSLYGFYDFDIQDRTNLDDKDFTPLYNLMDSTYRKIVKAIQ
jgi:hypothetical protein